MKIQAALILVSLIAANSAMAQFVSDEPKKEPYICNVKSTSLDPNLKGTKVFADEVKIEDDTQVQVTTALFSPGKKRVTYVITRKYGTLEIYATDPGPKPKNDKGERVDRQKIASAAVSDGNILEMSVASQDQKIMCIPESSLKLMDHMKMNSQTGTIGFHGYSKPLAPKVGLSMDMKKLNFERHTALPSRATD